MWTTKTHKDQGKAQDGTLDLITVQHWNTCIFNSPSGTTVFIDAIKPNSYILCNLVKYPIHTNWTTCPIFSCLLSYSTHNMFFICICFLLLMLILLFCFKSLLCFFRKIAYRINEFIIITYNRVDTSLTNVDSSCSGHYTHLLFFHIFLCVLPLRLSLPFGKCDWTIKWRPAKHKHSKYIPRFTVSLRHKINILALKNDKSGKQHGQLYKNRLRERWGKLSIAERWDKYTQYMYLPTESKWHTELKKAWTDSCSNCKLGKLFCFPHAVKVGVFVLTLCILNALTFLLSTSQPYTLSFKKLNYALPACFSCLFYLF